MTLPVEVLKIVEIEDVHDGTSADVQGGRHYLVQRPGYCMLL